MAKTESEKIEVSPTKSFKGFKLSVNLKNAIKNALYVLVPAILAELVSNNMLTAGVAGIIGSAVCKAVEFYLTEIKL